MPGVRVHAGNQERTPHSSEPQDIMRPSLLILSHLNFSTLATVIFPSFSHGSHAKSSPEDERSGWWEFIIGPGEYLDTNKVKLLELWQLFSAFSQPPRLALHAPTTL